MYYFGTTTLLIATCMSFGTASAQEHFDPKGKPPTAQTLELMEQARATLNFADERDFEENDRGLIATPDYLKIMADAGNVAWDMESYSFLLSDEDIPSIHPSLQRQARLNMNFGLYEVIPDRIYQVRGFDLSNITFVATETGWVVFDPLVSTETARAAMELLHENVDPRPVRSVVFSHSHGDHFGGWQGVATREQVESGDVEIIAPQDFLSNAVAENVFAGNAMNRRLFYQYGVALPRNPYGHVDQSIGKNTSVGVVGLIGPTIEINEEVQNVEIDGLQMIFQNTPNTEAPSAMHTFFPQLETLWMAENVTHTQHNVYTLRGTLIRDALTWSKQIARAIYFFGADTEVLISSHGSPRWGNDRAIEVLKAQRDLYAHLNNHALHLANQGITVNEVQNEFFVPKGLQDTWHTRGYHGSYEHNLRGVVMRYLGYWDANPATLIPLNPSDSAPLYVEMMGGSKVILAKSTELFDSGDYKLGVEILNKLVYAEPGNQTAKDALADHFEQLGYQQESPSLRNSFLAGAYELRNGVPTDASTPKSTGPDMLAGMSTELFLDFLGVRMDAEKAEGMAFTVNLIHPDNGERFVLEMSNSVLSAIAGFLVPAPDMTITIDRSDMVLLMAGVDSLDAMVTEGRAAIQGDLEILAMLNSVMIDFDPLFEIMPGTRKDLKLDSPDAFSRIDDLVISGE